VTLRKSIWEKDSVDGRDVGEALRDHDETLRKIPTSYDIEAVFTYAPPFYLRAKFNPSDVVLVRARPDKGPGVISTGSVSWEWKSARGIQVNSIVGLTAGGRYLLTFRVVS
jgi:hypothetical protein